jgi:phosphatidate cytidylyltransferase
MFWQRAVITFTIGPLVLLLIYLGGWFYFLPFVGLLTIGILEYSELLGKLGLKSPPLLLVPPSLAFWLVSPIVQNQLFGGQALQHDLTAVLMLLSLLGTLLYALWLYERRTSANAPGSWLATMFGIVFLGWFGSHFFLLRGIGESPVEWTALAFGVTWVADSGGYVFGKTLGKRRLSPRVSPNKTVAGYLGGILSGLLASVLIALLLDMPMIVVVIVGLLVTVISPAGDLGISLLKRSAGVKDSGQFLPGHGGALDRVDSLVWSLAMTYYLVPFLT